MLSVKSLFGDDAYILDYRDFEVLLLANLFPTLGSGLLLPILDSLRGCHTTVHKTCFNENRVVISVAKPANVPLRTTDVIVPALVRKVRTVLRAGPEQESCRPQELVSW